MLGMSESKIKPHLPASTSIIYHNNSLSLKIAEVKTDIIMVHRISNHHTTRDQYKQKLISLSNKNLELEEKATKQEQQISELVRLVRSFQSEESTEHIVDLTLQVEKVQRLLIDVSQLKQAPPSHILHHHPEQISSISEACKKDAARTSDNHSAGNSIKLGCNSCTQHNEKIKSLEEELNDYRSKNEALERSLKTLRSKNAEREIRSMTSLRQMRRQIDMLEHDRKRMQFTQATLEERVTRLEAEKEVDSKEIQELVMKCSKLEAEIRHTFSCSEGSDHSDNKKWAI